MEDSRASGLQVKPRIERAVHVVETGRVSARPRTLDRDWKAAGGVFAGLLIAGLAIAPRLHPFVSAPAPAVPRVTQHVAHEHNEERIVPLGLSPEEALLRERAVIARENDERDRINARRFALLKEAHESLMALNQAGPSAGARPPAVAGKAEWVRQLRALDAEAARLRQDNARLEASEPKADSRSAADELQELRDRVQRGRDQAAAMAPSTSDGLAAVSARQPLPQALRRGLQVGRASAFSPGVQWAVPTGPTASRAIASVSAQPKRSQVVPYSGDVCPVCGIASCPIYRDYKKGVGGIGLQKATRTEPAQWVMKP